MVTLERVGLICGRWEVFHQQMGHDQNQHGFASLQSLALSGRDLRPGDPTSRGNEDQRQNSPKKEKWKKKKKDIAEIKQERKIVTQIGSWLRPRYTQSPHFPITATVLLRLNNPIAGQHFTLKRKKIHLL